MFSLLNYLDDFFWSYIAFVLILSCGLYFSFKAKFSQITLLPLFCKSFWNFSKTKLDSSNQGIHPLKIFFASAGGTIGIGNVVGVVSAACAGGPGALFWVWIAGLIGSVVKYSEVYLGIKYRKMHSDGCYSGGPMHFLKKAFNSSFLPTIVSILLCIYGVEIYQFSIIVNSISLNWEIPRLLVIGGLLSIVLYTVVGGLRRTSKICSILLPAFLCIYFFMGFFILFKEFSAIPALCVAVFKSAFTGHAALGGFAGCTIATTIRQGISRAAYSGDIGIGFDSVIQSESAAKDPSLQASLSIVGIFIDNFVCTMSILIVLISGSWLLFNNDASLAIQSALSKYFPGIKLFFPMFLFLTGYTTITSYFIVGKKCASFLFNEIGSKLYVIYGAIALMFFCFLPQDNALTIMSISGALLLIINLLGIFKLRNEIRFPTRKVLKIEVNN